MSDYIKREDAVKIVSKVDDYGDGVGFEVRSHCLVELETLPPADVRKVVLCKECMWGKPYSDKQLECDALGLGGLKFPDDFCSYGERKDNE